MHRAVLWPCTTRPKASRTEAPDIADVGVTDGQRSSRQFNVNTDDGTFLAESITCRPPKATHRIGTSGVDTRD